jgi:hypothetical protein
MHRLIQILLASKIKQMKRLLFLLFAFTTFAGYAQYPISSINISMPSSPAANTAAWTSAMPPVMITAQAQLRNGQVPGDVQECRILVTIRQGGSKKYGAFTQDNAPSAGFTTAVKTWSGGTVVDLLGKDITLAAGSYELCVQFFSYNTPAKPLSNEVCKPFAIADAQPDTKPITNIGITMSPTPPANTANWSTIMPPVMITAQSKLVNGKVPQEVIASKILVTIKQGGSKKYGAFTQNNAPESGFTTAVKTWSGASAVSLLGQDATLPPGSYELCVQLFTQGAAGMVAISDEKCKPFTIQDSKDDKYTPPTNINPADKQVFTDKDTKGILTFRWIPVLPPLRPMVYKLKVWQLMQGQTATQAMQSNQPVLEKEVKDQTQATVNSFFTGPCKPPYMCNWVWRVEATDGQGKVFGVSEATTFILGESDNSYSPPVNQSPADKQMFTEKESKEPLTFRWIPLLPKPSYPVTYRLQVCALPQGSNSAEVIKNSQPLIQEEIKDQTQFVYRKGWNGKGNYLWWIEAIDGQGKVLGSSEATGFAIAGQYIIGIDSLKIECPKSGVAGYTYNFKVKICNPNAGTAIFDKLELVMVNSVVITAINITSTSPAIGTNIPAGGCIWITGNFNYGSIFTQACIKGYIKDQTYPTLSKAENFACANVPKCNPTDCCKGSYWGEKHIEGIQQVPCGTTLPQALPCNTTQKVSFTYFCAPGIVPPCAAKINYLIKDAAGNTVSSVLNVNSGASANITTPSTPGFYCLVVYATCNQFICDSCKICFKVECPQQAPCCKGSSWINKQYSISNPLIKTAPVKVDCNKSYVVPYDATGTITFNADYLCNTPNCTKQVFVKIMQAGSPDIIAPVPYSLPLNIAGDYSITYYAKCGKDNCDSCKFNINILDKPTDCCKGSFWISKSINWPSIIDNADLSNPTTNTNVPSGQKTGLPISGGTISLPPTSINIANCETSYKLSQGGTYTFNADYQCATKTCAKQLLVKIKGIGNSWYDGTFAMPKTITFNNPGDYAITYIAICGTDTCARCPFVLTIDKNCCLGSHWKKADYQIVNLNADGSWDRSDATFYNLLGGSIPTLKADLGISIENLSFECAADRDCRPGYIIKRKNLTTGALVLPDETLPAGQISTSIYSKPFPQLIIITPTCGGQLCGPAIIFRVECLHKDCIPCINISKKNLNFSTGQNGTGGQIALGVADPFWNGTTSVTGPNATWNNITGATILAPTTGGIMALGNQTFSRCFYICEPSILNFNGLFRDDNTLISFNLTNSASTPVWTYTGTPAFADPQCYVSSPYSGSTGILPAGKYCFNFSYNSYNSVGGFALTGNLVSSKNSLVNNQLECCAFTSSSTGHPGGLGTSLGSASSSVAIGNLDIEPKIVSIGDTAFGGIVAYILQPGDTGYVVGEQHGLIWALEEQGVANWGCPGMDIATSTALGSGAANTINITNLCTTPGTAARICNDLVLNGYSDWYLPSIGEMIKLMDNAVFLGVLHFSYSTSSQYDLVQNYGNCGVCANRQNKGWDLHVRAVRSF